MKENKKYQVISASSTRMNGSVSRATDIFGNEVYIKRGSSYERLEITREKEYLVLLNGIIPVPKILGFRDDGLEAEIVLSKAPGYPMHSICTGINPKRLIEIMVTILSEIWNASNSLKGTILEYGLKKELDDILTMITSNRIDVKKFEKTSGGISPDKMYADIISNIDVNKFIFLTHGDFCLPNIILDDDYNYTLIDWGKAGFADRFRDLSALRGSLTKNIDAEIFDSLLNALRDAGISDEYNEEQLNIYDKLDMFWYNRKTE